MTLQEACQTIMLLHGSPLQRISDSLRAFICASPGNMLIDSDWSQIESRVLSWLAGEEWVLDVYRGDGKVYERNAALIYRKSMEMISSDERLIGKVSELGLGFGGGKGAFVSMARQYGKKVKPSQAESIKLAWRKGHPRIVKYWYNLEHAAIAAVRNPGRVFSAGALGREVTYEMSGSFLLCDLPSGGTLVYAYPKVKQVPTPWGELKDGLTFKSVDSKTYKWTRETTYGGKLAENVTQAVARDILANGLLDVDDAGYTICMHVHDEILTHQDKKFGSAEEMSEIMATGPRWAVDLPLAAAGWKGKRYRK